jgi:hypothetical protein
MKRYVNLFESYDGSNEVKTWTFLMMWFLLDKSFKLLSGSEIGKRMDIFFEAARRNGVDPKSITPSTDGSVSPTFEFKASTSSLLAILYDLVEAGIIKEDITDLDEIIPMFLKDQTDQDGYDGYDDGYGDDDDEDW